jgi:hypothetical protein
VIKAATCGIAGALGGTRTPSLLIRRDLHARPLPAHMSVTCRNATQQCVAIGGAKRCCPAKIRPVRAVIPCLQSPAKVSSTVAGLGRCAASVCPSITVSKPVGVGCGRHLATAADHLIRSSAASAADLGTRLLTWRGDAHWCALLTCIMQCCPARIGQAARLLRVLLAGFESLHPPVESLALLRLLEAA